MIKKVLILFANLLSSFYLMKAVDQITLTTNLQRCLIFIYFLVTIYILDYFYYKWLAKHLNKNEKKLIILISLLGALFFVQYKGMDLIPKEYIDSQISITTSNEKNTNSNGNEVWILGINIDGNPIDLKSLESISGFTEKEDSGALVAIGGEENGICNIDVKGNSNVDIIFGMHAWSGVVYINNLDKYEKLDLYDVNSSQYVYHIEPNINEMSNQYKVCMIVSSYIVISCIFIFALTFLFLKVFKIDIKYFSSKIIIGLFQVAIMTLYYEKYGKMYFAPLFFNLMTTLIVVISVVLIGKNIINNVIKGKKCGYLSLIMIISLYWSFALFGKSLFNDLNFNFQNIALFILISIVMIPIIVVIFYLLDKLQVKKNTHLIVRKNTTVVLFAILFIILLIASFALYPGVMTSDGADQWIQALGRTPIYDAHTPTHTLMIRFCAYIWKNPYMVILVQIFTFSLIIALLLNFLIKKGLPLILGYIIAFVIAISPSNIAMTSMMSKNIAFTIIFLWVLYQLLILLDNKEAFMFSLSRTVMFGISLALLQLVRKNTFTAVYFIFLLLIIIGIQNYKKFKWRPFTIIILCIILVKFIEGPIYKYYQVEGHVDVSSGVKEPCYMAINAVLSSGLEVSESDKEKLNQVLDLDLWKSRYNAYNYDIFSWSDPLPKKGALSNSEVIGISLRLMREYPIVMVKSRLDATDIIWNVVKPPYVNVSRYAIGSTIPESLREYLPELTHSEFYKGGDLYLKENKLTPYLVNYLEKTTKYTLTELVFWRVGLYFGLSITLLFYSLYRKKENLLIVCLFGLSMMLSLLIALGWQIYQYVWYYSLFTIVLLLYSFIYKTEDKDEITSDYTSV